MKHHNLTKASARFLTVQPTSKNILRSDFSFFLCPFMVWWFYQYTTNSPPVFPWIPWRLALSGLGGGAIIEAWIESLLTHLMRRGKTERLKQIIFDGLPLARDACSSPKHRLNRPHAPCSQKTTFASQGGSGLLKVFFFVYSSMRFFPLFFPSSKPAAARHRRNGGNRGATTNSG